MINDIYPMEALGAVSRLVSSLTERAEQHDAGSTLSTETLSDLKSEGMFRLGTPRQYDGAEVSVATAAKVCEELAHGCPAAAWTVGIAYGGSRSAAQLSAAVRSDIWKDSPDVIISTTAKPAGDAIPTDAGWQLSGRWGWISGLNYSQWAFLGFMDRRNPDQLQRSMALVPTASLDVQRTWAVAGLRATRSDTAIADGVAIDEAYALSLPAMAEGAYSRMHPAEPRAFLHLTNNVPLAGVVIGIAAAVLAAVVSRASTGQRSLSPLHRHVADAGIYQAGVADAATRIDAARLLLQRAASDIDHAAEEGRELPLIARTRIRSDISFAVRAARHAVGDLLDTAGSSSFADQSLLQRLWRDIETASRHAAFSTAINLELHGALLLGRELPEDPTL